MLLLSRSIRACLLLAALAWPTRIAVAQAATSDLARRASMSNPRPGDRVILHVYGEPAFNDAATVDENGNISLPRIGLIPASSYSIAALRDTIRMRMGAFLKEAIIEVAVQRRIIVSGEVIKPGVYFADLSSSFGEMVAQSGGLRETASAGKVYRVREGSRTSVRDWQFDQSPAADLQSGDLIVVGRKSWLELNIIPVASLTISTVGLVAALWPRNP
jgi:protein involved in polysaccharide export with SLBB domain